MVDRDIKALADRKTQMAWILFWIFVAIFSLTAAFAFMALGQSIFITGWLDADPSRKSVVQLLLGAVVVEVAAGVMALWRNLFGLSAAEDVSKLSNTLSDIIDGLEANGDISDEKANAIRAEYADIMGISGSARAA